MGLLLPPLAYLRLAAAGLVTSSLCLLWSLWLPAQAGIFYLMTSATAAAWSPILAYPFLDSAPCPCMGQLAGCVGLLAAVAMPPVAAQRAGRLAPRRPPAFTCPPLVPPCRAQCRE